jgi:hypothetical protein
MEADRGPRLPRRFMYSEVFEFFGTRWPSINLMRRSCIEPAVPSLSCVRPGYDVYHAVQSRFAISTPGANSTLPPRCVLRVSKEGVVRLRPVLLFETIIGGGTLIIVRD